MRKLYFSAVMLPMLILAFTACKEDKVDVIPPDISLSGDASMRHVLNAPWVEPGFTAIDDLDGVITDKVEVSELNVNRTGIQEITYTVRDAAGNTTSVIRTVEVYNQAEILQGFWQAEYIMPYPGTAKQAYLDSLKASSTTNMDIIFKNFSNYPNSMVVGKVIPTGVINAPLVQFQSQAIAPGTLNVTEARFNASFTELTIAYYIATTSGDVRGVMVLNKQTSK
jgi:hypothetical protein